MDKLQQHISDAFNSRSEYSVVEILHSEPSKTPIRIDGGAVCVCTKGEAVLIIDAVQYNVVYGSEIILFPDMTVFFEKCSTNFTLDMFIFSRQIFNQALIKFDPFFFQSIYSNPIYQHVPGCESITLAYLQILRHIKSDSRNTFRRIIAMNLLRSIMLNIYDKINRFSTNEERTMGKRDEELYNRFMALIGEHSKEHRNVAFYAEKLCITPRYLAQITNSIAGETPKQAIDLMLIQEIKLLLTFSQMSIQQISDHLHFPDQSYLGRYFKKHTGISPANYRKNSLTM